MQWYEYTVRWMMADDLNHYVRADHKRWCDGEAVKGYNHEAHTITCLKCATSQPGVAALTRRR